MNRSLDLEWGKALPLTKASEYLGVSASELRAMCAGREVDHLEFIGKNGRVNYRMSESQVRAWIREHTVTAA